MFAIPACILFYISLSIVFAISTEPAPVKTKILFGLLWPLVVIVIIIDLVSGKKDDAPEK